MTQSLLSTTSLTARFCHRLLAAVLLTGLSLSASAEPDFTPEPEATADPFALLAAEQIGPLKLGTPASQLPAMPGCKTAKLGPIQFWGADGMYHQTWSYPACGLELGMAAEQPKQLQSIFSINIKAPSKLATRRGIRIGSSAQQAKQAYADEYSAADSQPGKTMVFGSIYGGLIMYIHKDKVSEIFLGAAAE